MTFRYRNNPPPTSSQFWILPSVERVRSPASLSDFVLRAGFGFWIGICRRAGFVERLLIVPLNYRLNPPLHQMLHDQMLPVRFQLPPRVHRVFGEFETCQKYLTRRGESLLHFHFPVT